MRKLSMVLLAVSLVAFAVGLLLDAGRLVTGGLVLSGCLAGTLVGDTLRRRGLACGDGRTAALCLGGMGLVLLLFLLAGHCLHLDWMAGAMPGRVTGVLCFAVLSCMVSALLAWRMTRRRGCR